MNEYDYNSQNQNFENQNANNQPPNTGINVNDFLNEVEQENQFKSDRVKVDLKEFTYNPKSSNVPPEGHEIRIVPPLVGKAHQKIDFHWNVGSSKMIVCPSQFGRPCPVCEHLDRVKNNPNSTDSQLDQAKKQSARTRYFLPIVLRGRESEGVKWWGFPKSVLNAIAGFVRNTKYYGDISDIYSGNDITLTFPNGSDYANIMPAPIKTPLMVDAQGNPDNEKIQMLRESVKTINEVFIELPPNAINKILEKSNIIAPNNSENN
jgi:hypothetical protein